MTIFLCLLISYFIFSLQIFCDIPQHYQCTTQDPATNILEWMINLYDLICFELIIIVSIIAVLLLSILYSPSHLDNELRYPQRFFSHSTELEVFWTIVPALLLVSIAYPSFNLLYALDEDFKSIDLTVKIIGHQWYWSYEFLYENTSINFDSYMVNSEDLTPLNMSTLNTEIQKNIQFEELDHIRLSQRNFYRLLDVDNRLYLPTDSSIILLITSADVLHSWTIPSFGIKVDACPGRLTKATLTIKRPGLYYGQCSEICGINHGFMPIVVQGISAYSAL